MDLMCSELFTFRNRRFSVLPRRKFEIKQRSFCDLLHYFNNANFNDHFSFTDFLSVFTFSTQWLICNKKKNNLHSVKREERFFLVFPYLPSLSFPPLISPFPPHFFFPPPLLHSPWSGGPGSSQKIFEMLHCCIGEFWRVFGERFCIAAQSCLRLGLIVFQERIHCCVKEHWMVFSSGNRESVVGVPTCWRYTYISICPTLSVTSG